LVWNVIEASSQNTKASLGEIKTNPKHLEWIFDIYLFMSTAGNKFYALASL